MNQSAQPPQFKSRLAPAIGLFFLAPLVAEFLLGNLPIKLLPALIVLAPMYGGGALLIREVVRRTGRGWPTILLLALAYGIVEEAYTTQSLFNPDYLSLHMHLLDPAYIAALGIGGWWTIFVLNLHTAWSIATPIALVEALVPFHATRPWLGRVGLTVTSVLFAIGVVATTIFGLKKPPVFIASNAQFGVAALICIVLVVVAFRLSPARASRNAAGVPNPWIVGIVTLLAGSAILLTPSRWGWWAVLAILAADLVVTAAILLWSRSSQWSLLHKLAAGGGAAMAYAWHAFIENPVVANSGRSPRIGNAIFAIGAVSLIAIAAKHTATAELAKAQPLPSPEES